MTSDTSYVEDRFFITTVAEAKKLQGKFETKAQHQDRLARETRKPIPDGMTIEQLVEEMEENEDTVECTWCNDLFDKSECRKEVDLGWLCSRCEAAIKSRGETLTFRENNYWDFLDEDVSLTEAHVFKNLVSMPEAKDRILDLLRSHPEESIAKCFVNDQINIRYSLKPAPSSWSKMAQFVGYITDFNVVGEGNTAGEILLSIQSAKDATPYYRTLDAALKEVPSRNNITRSVLNALIAAAKQINGQLLTKARDQRAFNALSSETAEELRSHIIKITYDIPCDDYTAEDMPDDDSKEEWAEKAANNLASIKTRFFDEWEYGYAADAAGMVTNRTVYSANGEPADTVYYIATQWHAVGKITFDCPVEQLSKDAQNAIKAAKISGSFENIKAKREIDCIRLAFALTKYYKDVKFYEKARSTTLVASAEGEVLQEEPDFYNAF
jgi:hypothetical protein